MSKSTENLERGTIILLKSWEEHKSVNQEKVSLSEYEGLMKSICRTGDFRLSEKLLNNFLEFSKRHGGEKTPFKDARTLHNIAEWLENHILKWNYLPLVMEFYIEEARMWALAGKKNKEKEALQSACEMTLHLRSVEENAFREIHFNEEDFGEKKVKRTKAAWEKLYQPPQDELAFSLELFLQEHVIEPLDKESTAVIDCDQVRNNI